MIRGFDDFEGRLADIRSDPKSWTQEEVFESLRQRLLVEPSGKGKSLENMAATFGDGNGRIKEEFEHYCQEVERRAAVVPVVTQKPKPAEQPKPEEPIHRSDTGNAMRLVQKYGSRLRFCRETNSWLIWDGYSWARDVDGKIYQFARWAVADIYLEAGKIRDKEERKAHAVFAIRSESNYSLRAMASVAETFEGIPIRRENLDAHPFRLNVQNGVLNLETGLLEDHDPELYFSKILPIKFDLNNTAPKWEKFLDQIMEGKQEKKDYLQEFAGYCLTGSAREQCFLIFWGDGLNGKTTVVKVLLELLGPWAAQAPADTFLLHKNSLEAIHDLARIADKRLVVAVEPSEGSRLAEGLVKSLSGNDRITARHLYQGGFEYVPGYKVLIVTNHKPQIRGVDLAIWRRVRLVPFTWQVPEDQIDLDLFDKLKEEMPGILTWAVRGCLRWLNRGKLQTPAIVKAASAEYRSEQDQIHRWLDECCERGDDEDTETGKALYASYREWCIENGECSKGQTPNFTATKFGRRLQALGFDKTHTRTGSQYKNIKIKMVLT